MKTIVLGAVVCLLMIAAGLAVGPRVPDAAAQPDVGEAPDTNSCYGVADEAFGSTGGAPDGLSIINRTNGATTNIGGQTGTTDVEAIAFAPGTIIDPSITQQVLYTFDGTDFGYLNLTTGLFSSLNLPAPDGFTTVDGMTWDGDLQVFWVTDRTEADGEADRIAAYDPTTGATVRGPFSTGIATEPGWVDEDGLPYDDFDDVAIDPQEDFHLFALLNKGGTDGGLVELSKEDGSIIDYIGLFTPDGPTSDFDGDGVTDDIEGLAFFDDRQLYGSTGANGPGADINRLFLIDRSTGIPVTTYIGDFVGYADYEALGCLTVGASIMVEKGTSEPGGVPDDADVGPGPTITTRTVEWTYVITNTSAALDLFDVTLDDDPVGALFDQVTGTSQCAEGVILAAGEVLAPGESVTCTITGETVSGPYTNIATTTAIADPGPGLRELTVSDNDPSNYVGEPSPPVLEVVKTAVAGANADCATVTPVVGDGPLVSVASGGIVTFCITVTNTGGSPATAVTVTDDNATPQNAADDVVVPGLDNIDLDAGASATGAFEVSVSSLTPLVNTVTAIGTDPVNGTPTNSPTDTAQVQAFSSPELAVVKTVVAGTSDCADVTPVPGPDELTVELGDTVTFCVTVTNVGLTPATNVTVIDDNLTPADPADDLNVPGLVDITLGAGESATGALVIAAPQAGLNTVTATGTDPNTGQPTNSPTDPALLQLLGVPVLSVVKTVAPGVNGACDTVTPAPGLDDALLTFNDPVTFCVTVTNSGDTPAENVTVVDDNLTPADPADDTNVPGLIDITLAPGESATGAIVTTATRAGINTVTATGTDPNTGLPTNSPTDPAEIILEGGPQLDVVKTVVAGTSDCSDVTPAPGLDDLTIEVGQTITYCVTVTNNGPTFATDVNVVDDNLTPADPADDIDIPGLTGIRLDSGASATGALVTTARQSGINTVTATGTDPITGQPTNSPTDPAELILLDGPVLEVVKTIVAGTSDCTDVTPAPGLDDIIVEVGETVTYCVTVSNVGQTFATEVSVVDDNLTPNDPADDIDVPGLIDIRLEAGESATGAIVTTANQAGTNTVTATGTDPITGNPTNSPTDPAELILLDGPVLEVVKTIVAGTSDCTDVTPAPDLDDITVEVGEPITYCFTVTNVGATFATEVTVTDDNLTPNDPADDIDIIGLISIRLEAGESATGSLQTTANQAGINTATATGTDPITGNPTNSPTDPAELKLLGAPSLEVVKTIVAGTSDCTDVTPAPDLDEIIVEINSTVTYCVTVSNVGATFATEVTVTDDNLTPDDLTDDVAIPGLISIRLEAGETATGALVTTAAEAGINTVTATGTDPISGNPTNSPTDPAQVNLLGTPILEVVKTAVAGTSDCSDVTPVPDLDELVVEIGDTVTFCVTVTNRGDTTAENVTVTDDSLTPADPTDDVEIPGLVDLTLASGESATGALVTVANQTGTNTVTATGIDPNTGNPTNSPTDPAALTLRDGPILEVVKTVVAGVSDCSDVTPAPGADNITVEINQAITFCVTVTNVGETFATGVTVTDDSLTPRDPADDVPIPGLVNIRLEAGASATGALESTAVQAGVNTVTATGINPITGDPTNSPTDPAEVRLLGTPILEVVKTAVAGGNVDCSTVDPVSGFDEVATTVGATVTFCVTVTNVGDTTAEQVTVTDDSFTPDNAADDAVVPGLTDLTLAAGESATGSISITVTDQTPQTNTVTATGVDPNTSLPTNRPADTAAYRPPPGNAELAVVKTAVLGGDVDCATVEPASGEDAVGVEIGNSVTFCITVTNVGDGPAADVVVTDDNFTADPSDDVPVTGLDGIDLGPGESATGSFVVQVTELGDKTNIATAAGTDVNGNRPTNEPNDPARLVPFGTPILSITKTVVAGSSADCSTVSPAPGLDELLVSVGDAVTYCVVVTNTGDGPATDIEIVDDNFTPNNTADDLVLAQQAVLAPGASVTGSFTKIVSSADALQNTASATGTDPETGLPTNRPVDPAGTVAPAIDLQKQILRGFDQPGNAATEGVNELVIGMPGDVVTWVYTVTNDGSVPLIVDEIVDPSISITVALDVADQLIAPGDSVTVTANGVITDSGAMSEATVQGQPADENGQPAVGFEPLTAADDAAEGPAEITLTKQILRDRDRDCNDAVEGVNELVIAEPGDDVTWCYTVTNTGLSYLTDITFSDPDLAVIDLDVLATVGEPSLAPGESIQLPSANDIVPPGGIDSSASVTGVPSDENGGITDPAFAGAPELDDTNLASNDAISIRLEKRVLLGFDADCSLAVEGVDEGVKGRLGDDITWCFTAINTGSVALRITEIVDEVLDLTLEIPEDQQILGVTDPAASITLQQNDTILREAIVNTASVVGSAVDPNSGQILLDVESGEPVSPVRDENTASEAPLNADLRLDKSKTVPPGRLAVGSIIEYQLEIENKGPDTAQDLEVVDELPPGLEYVEVPTIPTWNCQINDDNNEMLCEKDRLRVGVVELLTYNVRVVSGVRVNVALVNTATVDFAGVDPTPEDNTDSETVRVTIDQPPVGTPDPTPTPPPPPPEDEVLPELVYSGAHSDLLVAISTLSILIGSTFLVLSRRRRDEHEDLR